MVNTAITQALTNLHDATVSVPHAVSALSDRGCALGQETCPLHLVSVPHTVSALSDQGYALGQETCLLHSRRGVVSVPHAVSAPNAEFFISQSASEVTRNDFGTV